MPPTHEVQECIQQWCMERLTFCNARSQTEGDDLGILLLGRPVGLVNETLEVIDGLRSLGMEHALASATGFVQGSLMSVQQYMVRLIQDHQTRHVQSN